MNYFYPWVICNIPCFYVQDGGVHIFFVFISDGNHVVEPWPTWIMNISHRQKVNYSKVRFKEAEVDDSL